MKGKFYYTMQNNFIRKQLLLSFCYCVHCVQVLLSLCYCVHCVQLLLSLWYCVYIVYSYCYHCAIVCTL